MGRKVKVVMTGEMTFGDAAALFATMAHKLDVKDGLEKAAAMLEEKAKAAIGSHEYGWPALTPETIARKANGDTPLLETGELRDSIGHVIVSSEEAEVGSDSPKAEWHELGTPSIPPRSFIAETGRRHEEEAVSIVADVTLGAVSVKSN